MSDNGHLKRQLSRYKDLLANFSRRNRELYFRESKGSTINLTKFPYAQNMVTEKSGKKFSGIRFQSPMFGELLQKEDLDLHSFFLFDDVKDQDAVRRMNSRLDRVRLADDKYQREYGISGAWMLGPFLCWRTSPQAAREDLMISPLFKVAVDIKKNSKKHLALRCETDGLVFNPSLRLYLNKCFGVEIPSDQDFESPETAIGLIQKALNTAGKSVFIANCDAVPKIPGRFKIRKDDSGEIVERVPVKLEEVLSSEEIAIYDRVTSTEFCIIDVVYLDQLSASRAVLINDYERIIESGLDHPILGELFNGAVAQADISSDRSKLRELDSYKERDNHFVVDIDSTQHRAIDRATKSNAIVIQGPPGSGKSQTIVNLIADYLAKGKKVLFVSEKRPALDVVFNRMKGANVESQSVLIHSSDLNKSELYNSFLELSAAVPNQEDERAWHKTADALDRVKLDINQYAELLQTQHMPSHLRMAELLVTAGEVDKKLFSPEIFETFKNIEYESLLALASELNEVQRILQEQPNLFESPWISRLPTTLHTSAVEHSLTQLNRRYAKYCSDWEFECDRIEKLSGDRLEAAGRRPGELFPVCLVSAREIEPFWGQLRDGIDGAMALLESIRTELKKLRAALDHFMSIKEGVPAETVGEIERYYSQSRGILDWFTADFWRFRKLRADVSLTGALTVRSYRGYREYQEAFGVLTALCEKLSMEIKLEIRDLSGSELSIERAVSRACDLVEYLKIAERALPARLRSGCYSSCEGFLKAQADIVLINSAHKSMESTRQSADVDWQSLNEFVSVSPQFDDLGQRLRHIERMIETLGHLSVLDRSDIAIDKAARRHEIPALKAALQRLFANVNESWGSVVLSSVLSGWRDEVLSKHYQLRSFDRSRLETLAREFISSVDEHKVQSRQAVHQAFAKRWTGAAADRSGLPILTREASKKRKVLSPREIMERGALNTMLQLKPCWLMSPLSISQLLPLERGLFDVIIFDEASQVRVEDAIPSIFRASTMIVVGDNKQMPPTAFFSGATADDDEDEEEISESILDLAAQVYPAVLLEWHYRSRSEALIAFSNRAFYGGRLIAAPNPRALTAGGAIRFMQVTDAYFTAKDGNPIEASRVIDYLVERILENPMRSYGVIAMGVSQANALQEALDSRMMADPKIANLIEAARNYKEGDSDAGLFIKNLENVQGDERDVIILSVGYAPAGPGKKLRLGFGPLSTKGGGRRLNVAITRAKHEMQVFCSFNPSEVPTDEETFARNPDLCVFGRYLKYAEAVSSGNQLSAAGVLDSFPVSGFISHRKPSRFSLDVKRRLEEQGYKVSLEIGTSGFYIDMAIHHPVVESSFLLGIECDGAIFHSTPYARDRDKIRQDLLESRGWKIIRVWSQDWSNDWRREIERIKSRVDEILEKSNSGLRLIDEGETIKQATKVRDDKSDSHKDFSAAARELNVTSDGAGEGVQKRLEARFGVPDHKVGNDSINTDSEREAGFREMQGDQGGIPLVAQLSQQGYQLVDKREAGGRLWVVAGAFEFSRTPFDDKSIVFQFAPNGGKATGHRPAWYLV